MIAATPEQTALNNLLLELRTPAPSIRILETRCAWCDEEAGVKVTGEGITHSICPRHLVSNLVFSNQEDTFEALFYTILGILAEGQR